MIEGQEEATAEQEIAEEDGDFVLPQGVDGEHAAPPLSIVHHVIVDERGRVQQFNQRRRPVARLGDTAAEFGREQHKNRADLLALLSQHVPCNLVQNPNVRPHCLAEVTAKLL